MISGISDREVFSRIRAEGRSVRSDDLKLRYLPSSGESTQRVQIAFSISRRVGNAVVRNRTRRRLRSAFVDSLGQYSDVLGAGVLIVLPHASERTYSELEMQVQTLLQKIEKSTDSTK